MGFIWSIIIGIVAGYLAGKIMRGGGFGVIVNLILGIIGGVLGGWVFSLLGISAGGILGSLITSSTHNLTSQITGYDTDDNRPNKSHNE